MWMVGGDIGGGTLEFQGQFHKFMMDGSRLGGSGAHKVKLDGDVRDMKDVVEYPGVYVAAGIGITLGNSGKGDVWLKNDKGMRLRMVSPSSKGIALEQGPEGEDIRME